MQVSFKWQPVFWLGLVLLTGFWLRLKDISIEPTDWHAFRQSDTASVTREYIRHGIDLLHPRFHDYSNIASGLDNPYGYRMVEFPIINALVAVMVRTWPAWDDITTGRVVAMVFSLASVVGIFLLGQAWSGPKVGLWAAASLAVLPYAVFYSRVILPEPFFVTTLIWGVLGFEYWRKGYGRSWYFISAVSWAICLLLKPFGLFFAPVIVLLAWHTWGWKMILQPSLYLFASVVVAPLVWWRWWIQHFPAGIPASDWLFNSDGIRWRPAWVRWLGWERITKLILGYVGVPFLALGIWPVPFKDSEVSKYVVWWGGVILYFSVIATGNVRHDYYQVGILPILCLTMGRGLAVVEAFLTTKYKELAPATTSAATLASLSVVFILLVIHISADSFVRGYYSTRKDWEYAGQAADKILPPDAKVIAPAFGDTAFLFQIDRHGWPLGFDIQDKINKGATHYVTTTDDDEARELAQKYQVIAQEPGYLIIDLTQPRSVEK